MLIYQTNLVSNAENFYAHSLDANGYCKKVWVVSDFPKNHCY